MRREVWHWKIKKLISFIASEVGQMLRSYGSLRLPMVMQSSTASSGRLSYGGFRDVTTGEIEKLLKPDLILVARGRTPSIIYVTTAYLPKERPFAHSGQ